MITEVGHVSDGHSGHGERLTIHASEPPGEFAKVVDDRFAGVVGVIIFVFPTFSDLPWYADHPTNPAIRQEMYFMKVVVPFVEASYPASDERLLLGFSKSGWGAWALLLRHPDVFRRAAAWDAPLMMEQVGKYGTSGIFGTQKNFEQYRPADLLREECCETAWRNTPNSYGIRQLSNTPPTGSQAPRRPGNSTRIPGRAAATTRVAQRVVIGGRGLVAEHKQLENVGVRLSSGAMKTTLVASRSLVLKREQRYASRPNRHHSFSPWQTDC